jgi:hypothetical protein
MEQPVVVRLLVAIVVLWRRLFRPALDDFEVVDLSAA